MKPPYVLSRTVEYALRATLFIAGRAPDVVRIPEIAAAIHAPPRYLSKILGKLVRAGFLESTRGPTGGFRLASRQEPVALASVVTVFEEPRRRRCLLGHGLCGENPGCAVHEKWAPIAQSSADFFANTTLQDLLPSTPHS